MGTARSEGDIALKGPQEKRPNRCEATLPQAWSTYIPQRVVVPAAIPQNRCNDVMLVIWHVF